MKAPCRRPLRYYCPAETLLQGKRLVMPFVFGQGEESAEIYLF